MPIFNVIRVNQTHLSKVMVARQNHLQEYQTPVKIGDFQRWRNYIRKQLKSQSVLSSSIEHSLS